MSKKQKKRTIVFGDIHGCYNEFIKLLKLVKYNSKKDKLILLGDYIDRGKDAYKVIKKIQSLQKKNKDVIALRGNHEEMMIDAYNESRNLYRSMRCPNWETWMWNGGSDTLKSFDEAESNLSKEIEWFKSLPYYYEDDERIYVHAGINPKKPLDEQSKYNLVWTREAFIFSNEKFEKQVIFGHTPSVNMTEDTMPYRTTAGNIGIDTACVYGGKLTAMIFQKGKELKFMQVEKEKETI